MLAYYGCNKFYDTDPRSPGVLERFEPAKLSLSREKKKNRDFYA
jgi:hypothetical protein